MSRRLRAIVLPLRFSSCHRNRRRITCANRSRAQRVLDVLPERRRQHDHRELRHAAQEHRRGEEDHVPPEVLRQRRLRPHEARRATRASSRAGTAPTARARCAAGGARARRPSAAGRGRTSRAVDAAPSTSATRARRSQAARWGKGWTNSRGRRGRGVGRGRRGQGSSGRARPGRTTAGGSPDDSGPVPPTEGAIVSRPSDSSRQGAGAGPRSGVLPGSGASPYSPARRAAMRTMWIALVLITLARVARAGEASGPEAPAARACGPGRRPAPTAKSPRGPR